MRVLELFSGTGSFSKVAKEMGHEIFTVELEPKFEPSLVKDIMELTAQEIIEKFGHPDIIWASPPCTTFSVASIYKYWEKGKPKNEKTLHGIAMVKKTIELIKELKPTFWFIENPRGMLRKQDFMRSLPRKTVTYCKYGLEYQKATDIWTNCNTWNSRPMCKPKAPCHVRSPRGSRYGIQGVRPLVHPDWNYNVSRSATLRGVVPKQLCEEVLKACEPQVLFNFMNYPTKENKQ